MLSCWGTFNLTFYTWKRCHFPGGTSGKELTCQCRRWKRCRFDPWVGKIPQKRKWQPTPVFLPGGSVDRGAWQTTVHRIAKSWTQLKWLSTLERDHGGGKRWHFIDLFLHPLIQWAFGWTMLCSWHWTGHWGNALQWNMFLVSRALLSSLWWLG